MTASMIPQESVAATAHQRTLRRVAVSCQQSSTKEPGAASRQDLNDSHALDAQDAVPTPAGDDTTPCTHPFAQGPRSPSSARPRSASSIPSIPCFFPQATIAATPLRTTTGPSVEKRGMISESPRRSHPATRIAPIAAGTASTRRAAPNGGISAAEVHDRRRCAEHGGVVAVVSGMCPPHRG
jgi:hypothetical protein